MKTTNNTIKNIKPAKLTTKELKTQKARADLLKYYINRKTKLLIIIKSISASGMTRRMKVYTDKLQNITYLVADLCDLSVNDNGLQITGCGMDMTFWLADNITLNLYNKNKPKWLKGNGGGSCRCLDWTTA